jgi:hypothetical protein
MNSITGGIDNFIDALKIGDAQIYRNLTVYPLYSETSGGNGFMLLDDALETKRFVVTEVDEAGNVPELKVINQLDLDVLILEGEELVGAKQNRIVNASILVGQNRELVIPVSCVEHGRWQYRGKAFRSGNSSVYAELRKKNMKSVHRSLKASATYRADQGEIWDDIYAKEERLSVNSETSAMNDIYKSYEKELKEYEEAFGFREEQTGFISLINGKVIGCDIFGQSAVLRKVYKKLLRSYIIDALDDFLSGKKTPEAGAELLDKRSRSFLANLKKAEREVFAPVGKGQDVRFKSRHLNGFALMNDSSLVHLAAFAE